MGLTHDDMKREAAIKRSFARDVAYAFTQHLDRDRPNLIYGRMFWLVCDLFEQLIWTHKLDELQGRLITSHTRDWIHNSVRVSIEQLGYQLGLESISRDIFYWLCDYIQVNGEPLPPPALPEKKETT